MGLSKLSSMYKSGNHGGEYTAETINVRSRSPPVNNLYLTEKHGSLKALLLELLASFSSEPWLQ